MSTQKPSAKLPKGLPKLPPIPNGYDKWKCVKRPKEITPVTSPMAFCHYGNKEELSNGWLRSDPHPINTVTYGSATGKKIACLIAIKSSNKTRPVAKHATAPLAAKSATTAGNKPKTNASKIERALAMVAESRPSMSLFGHEQRMAMEAAARASIAAKKAPTVSPANPIKNKVHHLKTWPEFFSSVDNGDKPFEVRNNDRDFKVGDLLILEEWNPKTARYSGRSCKRTVTFMLNGGAFGIEAGNCVLGFGASKPSLGVIAKRKSK